MGGRGAETAALSSLVCDRERLRGLDLGDVSRGWR